MSNDPAKFNRALVEVTVAASAEETWRALRDPARIRQWFGWDTDTLTDEVEHIFITHAQASDAERVLRMGLADWFEVEARGDSSVVRVVRAAPTADTDWDEVFEDMTQGWIAFVQQLKFALERHPGADRRTVFLSGAPQPGKPLAIPALGLPTSPVGSPYSVAGPAGQPLAGTVWHRGRHQVGVTVDGVGDGLLVVMDRQPGGKHPTGVSSVTLTTYGLDDRAFAELRGRWEAWWSTGFVAAPPTCD